MKANDISRLDIEEKDCKIALERDNQVIVQAQQAAVSAPVVEAPSQKSETEESFIEVKSPMVGVFYAAKAPGEKNFVAVGDKVVPGDVLCIIEAMKLMNDITAEQAGTVVEICAANGDIVEYGQVLFKLK